MIKKKWLSLFLASWIVSFAGAYTALEIGQLIGWPLMTLGDCAWLFTLYKMFEPWLKHS